MALKILIIRFSSIGDIVLTTPVIRMMKLQIEDVEVHFVTKKGFESLLTANPYLTKVHVLNNGLKPLIQELKAERFSHVIDLHNNLRSAKIKRAIDAPSRSFKKLNIEKWRAVNFKQINSLPKIHIVDRYLETISSFNIKNDSKGLDYYIPKGEHVEVSSLPLINQDGYISWVIGGSYFTKILPIEKIIEVIRQVKKPIILLGGQNDIERGKAIALKIGKQVYNACGKYSINQSASIIKQAEKVLTNDTGLMHISAAFDKPILSFWGNTIPEFGMYPYQPQLSSKSMIIQVEDLNCRPCSKLGYKKCPKSHFYCMQLIDIDRIVEWIGN